MPIYLIGTGRMGALIARRLAPHHDLILAGRDPAKLAALAEPIGAATAPLATTDFAGAEAILLALPTEATAPVLAEIAPRIPVGAVVINIATAVLRKELEPHFPADRLAGAKLVAHYYDMAAGGAATVVIDAGSPAAAATAERIMQHVGPTAHGQEGWVLTANRTATEEAVRLALRMRRRLEAAGIPADMIRQATHGVAVGSLRAFVDGRLGPFGQAIADRVEAELAKDGL